jgi:hypothetical protein
MDDHRDEGHVVIGFARGGLAHITAARGNIYMDADISPWDGSEVIVMGEREAVLDSAVAEQAGEFNKHLAERFVIEDAVFMADCVSEFHVVSPFG